MKDIEFGISARYKPADIDPFTTSDIYYLYTDDNGEVNFPFFRFTIFGYAGTYNLIYMCNGERAKSASDISVTTSITQIRFAVAHPTYVYFSSPRFIDYHIIFYIECLNA